MNLTRLSLLVTTFLSSMIYQPNWAYENFWSKAAFYESVPFTVPFFVFLLIYALFATGFAEMGIRFIKKYA